MKKMKCTNCGSEDLRPTDISGPTDDGFFTLSSGYTSEGIIKTYYCAECGHIEFFVVKKEKNN